MKNKTAWILIAVLFLPVLLVVYSVVVVIDARVDTPGILLAIEASGRIKYDASRLKPEFRKILLMVEDPAFFEHKGIDLVTPGAGLTTITQSIVKQLYFHPFRPGFAKLRQSLIALFVLDRMVSKERQLTLFLNLTYFGRSRRGPEWGIVNASRGYFNKTVGQLTRREFISLIAMLVSPSGFNMITRPDVHRERVRRIEMLTAGKYKPKGLRDIFYGPLKAQTRKHLAPASYSGSLYR